LFILLAILRVLIVPFSSLVHSIASTSCAHDSQSGGDMRLTQPYMWALVVTGSVLIGGCAGLTKGQADLDIGMKERGIASWYGDDFHGWVTASGEIYDMHMLTAAHRTLPLGTIVRVTNVVNGRHVMIRINDRGPYVNGRILDVSYAAAKRLDMLRDGISAIQLEVVGQHGLGPMLSEPPGGQAGAAPSQKTALHSVSVSMPQVLSQIQPLDRGPRLMPADVIRERRARRVGDIMAADCRVEVVAELALA
jgi:rare lipoprotein A